MGSRIQCFMLERSDRFRRSLRRFTYGIGSQLPSVCPGRPQWGHDASVDLDVVTIETDLEGTIIDDIDRTDPRWPTRCGWCDYRFVDTDEWQARTQRLYRAPSGELIRPRDAGPGAMWFVPWYDSLFVPQLEHVLVVMLPGRTEWVVDSQASNCTIGDDHRQERHHCWVISGTLPFITAGKGGQTCSAGAGSIAAPGYHGFLRAGFLEEC